MKWKIETRNVKTQTYAVDFTYDADQVTTLVTELRAVRELYLKQKALTTAVCEKYVKMRDSKEAVIRKMSRMEEHYQETLQEAMTNFDRDRVAFALLEKDGSLPRELHADLVGRCAKLDFNNAALHAAMLKMKSERLRRRTSKDLMGDVSIFYTEGYQRPCDLRQQAEEGETLEERGSDIRSEKQQQATAREVRLSSGSGERRRKKQLQDNASLRSGERRGSQRRRGNGQQRRHRGSRGRLQLQKEQKKSVLQQFVGDSKRRGLRLSEKRGVSPVLGGQQFDGGDLQQDSEV